MFKQMPDQGNITQERDFDGVITLRRLINTTQDDRPAILNTDFGAQILSIDGVACSVFIPTLSLLMATNKETLPS